MAKIVAGIGTSHVPSIGVAYDQGRQEEPDWKPLFDGYGPVKEWLKEIRPDIAIVVYNDHGCDFFFDKYPTFAVGAAETYPVGDEGWGRRPLPDFPGDADFSWHLCNSLVYDEFDITVCQEMEVEHGFMVPMHLCWDHDNGWPVQVVPVAVNVIQHPLPTAARCWKLGQAIRRAAESYGKDRKVVILGTGGMSHQLNGARFGYLNSQFDNDFLDKIESDPAALTAMTHQQIMEEAGAEAVELIMWLTMRGAIEGPVRQVHRHYYAPMTTGMGLIALEAAS
ncbi:MAG: protocatechuate 3,4-dioxygenase [Rhodospirillaceae bacterium]|nr:protocatechuate 3,4-dioxygenase [Rhodospirillaceae bacterium]|tara:strand:+ start:100 stop:939 length:840 start_codon:yes stop_codon:yes gene_type:complete